LECAIRLIVFTLAICSATFLNGQAPSSSPRLKPQSALLQHPEWPKANAADVDTIEDTVRAFYSAISAPPGGKLNRDRLHSLFVPDGRIVVGLQARPGRAADVMLLTLDEYADRSDAATASGGFFDRNIANHVQRFGVMAQVYSTYESRSHLDDKKPMARGIKSFELLNSANRWYIVQIYWDSERPDNPIPDRYLHDSSDSAGEPR
jgi:hypothetical protein